MQNTGTTLAHEISVTLTNSVVQRLSCTQPGYGGKYDVEDLGLVDLGTGNGSFVKAIGYSEAAPDLAIKVVGKRDPWVTFAAAVLDGELSGAHYPVIHSITVVGDNVVAVMERLPHGYRDACRHDAGVLDNDVQKALPDLVQWAGDNDFMLDLHTMNVMYRADYTFVVIDPVWDGRRSGGGSDCSETSISVGTTSDPFKSERYEITSSAYGTNAPCQCQLCAA